MYARNVDSHKYLEIIEQDNKYILLYSDDGATITKETHTYDINDQVIGFLEKGAIVESVTIETASGSWADRYTLDYSSSSAESPNSNESENNDTSENNGDNNTTVEAGAFEEEDTGDGPDLDDL